MAAPKKKRHLLGRLSFGGVALVLSSLLLLSYLSVLIDPSRAWFFTIFGLLYPVVFPVTLVLFVWAIIRRSRMTLILAVALLPSVFFFGKYVQLRCPDFDREPSLSMVSYNVGLFSHGPSGSDRLSLADSTAAYLMDLDADIICLQEFWLPRTESIDAWISRHFPGYKAEYYVFPGFGGRFGNVTLSRRAFTGKGKNTFDRSTNLAVYTDVRLDSCVLRLYNCHFESYNISLPALVKTDVAVEETERKMRRSISERPKQVAQVLRGVDSAPVHSVVLGDFNDTPLSYTYLRLRRGRKDSFTTAGKGWGATYSILWPLLRIDYILYPPELQAVSCIIDRVDYSDHYPVFVKFYETGRDSR